MDYHHLKAASAFCPTCSQRLELLLPAENINQGASFYLCFKCKSIHQFGQGRLTRRQNTNFIKEPDYLRELRDLIKQIPAKYQYAAQGSQLRYTADKTTLKRNWLSLAEYERIFNDLPPSGKCDFRQQRNTCKWCGNHLTSKRRSFCRESCSRHYSKKTFQERSLATLPYRIACRDHFICQVSGLDLALINQHQQRIPAVGKPLAIHHLVHVAEGGSDHQANLITLDAEIHRRYHQGESDIVSQVQQIKLTRERQFADLMKAK